MKPQDIQQLVRGFNTVEVIGGPMVVRVHEALDSCYQGTPHRYFISVDLKFRQCDALNIGNAGWLGCTKAEALRDARRLAERIMAACTAVNAAAELCREHDTPTNRTTLLRQRVRLDAVAGRYEVACFGYVEGTIT